VLLALDKYFRIYEKDVPDFVMRTWYGEDFAGEQIWKGRSTDTNVLNIPMNFLFTKGDQNLIIQKEGKGRLYYRIGLDYAPTSLTLKAAQYGFKVDRQYEGVDDPNHVTKDKDGTWHFKLGEKIKVVITMWTPSRRYHVALVDKLPAGIECLVEGLAGTVSSKSTPSTSSSSSSSSSSKTSNPFEYRWYSEYDWYNHKNLRDERAEAFKDLLWEGKYKFVYTTRATSSGQFVVPPAKAEEMYSPELFGRSASDKVIIEK